tara:strand:+ start:18693 stop:19601 length:909 start_codon:yes stop_codon:yes gene_type:complete
MKLGGHETFYPRHGWLTKGLLHLSDSNVGTFSSPDVADDLGVGRNMAKSIGWWLNATGLAERTKTNGRLQISKFGQVIAERDPFMVRLGTLWLIYVTMQTARTGTTLPWFFEPQRMKRFDRTALIEDLTEELTRRKGKPPSTKSVQREVAAVLQTFAVSVPKPIGDPEDNLGSPFHRLSLLRHLRSTDRFETGEPTPVPVEALGLLLSALGLSRPSQSLEQGVDLTIPGSGPILLRAGSILRCKRENLLDMAADGAKVLTPSRMNLRFLASERVITLKSAQAADWATLFFDRMIQSDREKAA